MRWRVGVQTSDEPRTFVVEGDDETEAAEAAREYIVDAWPNGATRLVSLAAIDEEHLAAEALQRRIEEHCEQFARDECDEAGHPVGPDGVCPCGFHDEGGTHDG